MPSTREIIAMRSSMMMTLPPERNSTNSVIISPRPVSVTVPTTMPAVAVATAMPIMLRAPSARPSTRSSQPVAMAFGIDWFRKRASSGFLVATMPMTVSVPQKAERPGES